MSEFEAIRSVTKNAAELLGLQKEVGTVEVGKIADLVVLNANPVNDISNMKEVCCVIKDGVIVYNQ